MNKPAIFFQVNQPPLASQADLRLPGLLKSTATKASAEFLSGTGLCRSTKQSFRLEPHPSNGLLLRTDIHRLFDLGYVTVSPDKRFEVSHRLKDDFDNGRHYYDLHGTSVRPPRSMEALPSADALAWHRENRHLG